MEKESSERSEEEIPPEYRDHLANKDVLTEEEFDEFTDYWPKMPSLCIINSESVEIDGKKYDIYAWISVLDGQYPDEMNTSITVVEKSG
ncbi:hypothetical protein AKJ62_03690 [candidate division MSBL1 archaeon SCGC-AAA259D14]|uniref:Uncharacterized protein n=1 Tax=candidate division MSBL1 archaeon SCGC-AAA259D14 TaxID=1698261 RepID=A0A133U4S2_9EURY|nr:hypothetical protein AKJ62_03690 [candidate division MSBL1 archaeon SCGC-AAA259D14]